jgi:hypothetical protein
METLMSYLAMRGPVYYFRRAVPIELRSVIGKSEIMKSLRTKDRATAEQCIPIEMLKADALFEEGRIVLADVAGDQLRDLFAAQQLADTFIVDADIVSGEDQVTRTRGLDRIEQAFGKPAKPEPAARNRHAVKQQAFKRLVHQRRVSSCWFSSAG